MITPPDIEFSGSVAIDGARLFSPLSFCLKAGCWTCLLGSSGVGKSTILRLIAGLKSAAVFTGRICASDGEDIPPRVAYMAQDDLLLPWSSVSENILLGAYLRGARPDREKMQRLLERVGLAKYAHRKPHMLSGGQRQRVALARTLMEDKPIILLDEAFSALDARTRADMQDLAAELLAGRSVFLVTHDPGEAARLGQQVLIMDKNGVQDCPLPKSAPPRAVSDMDMLKTQAALLESLRQR